jgi:hypothetical protein
VGLERRFSSRLPQPIFLDYFRIADDPGATGRLDAKCRSTEMLRSNAGQKSIRARCVKQSDTVSKPRTPDHSRRHRHLRLSAYV